jgi:hypothetical protein
MRIRITGLAQAFDPVSEAPIIDIARLQALDGLVYDEDQCSNYFGGEVDLTAIGVTGGSLQLAFDAQSGRLLVVSEYTSPRKLKPKELNALVAETSGQWSDGIGEGIQHQWEKSHGVLIDFSPLDSGKPVVVQIDDGIEIKTPRRSPLLSAAEKGDIAKMRKLLERGEPVDARDKNGMTPLHLAILRDHVELAILLMDQGADLMAADKEGSLPITFACMRKLQPVVSALLDRGVSADARDGRGATPLMWAANRGSLPLVSMLLERGADPNAQDKLEHNEGHTPLMYVQATSLDVARYLLAHGADPKVRTLAGETISEIAARNTHQRGWQELLALYQAAESAAN